MLRVRHHCRRFLLGLGYQLLSSFLASTASLFCVRSSFFCAFFTCFCFFLLERILCAGRRAVQHTNLRSLAWKDGDWWEPFAIGATIMQNGIINKLSQESVLVRLPAF